MNTMRVVNSIIFDELIAFGASILKKSSLIFREFNKILLVEWITVSEDLNVA